MLKCVHVLFHDKVLFLFKKLSTKGLKAPFPLVRPQGKRASVIEQIKPRRWNLKESNLKFYRKGCTVTDLTMEWKWLISYCSDSP